MEIRIKTSDFSEGKAKYKTEPMSGFGIRNGIYGTEGACSRDDWPEHQATCRLTLSADPLDFMELK